MGFWLKGVLTLWSVRVECLREEALPVEVGQLSEDLAALDRVSADPALLVPIVERWHREVRETGRSLVSDGRPTIAAESFIRLMVLKARYRCGVSDACGRGFGFDRASSLLPDLAEPAGTDESTVCKLTRRIGPGMVSELTRTLIIKATRQKRFRARAVRIDSTVVEADVKYPTDASLAAHGLRALAREGRRLAERIGEQERRVRDRSRAMGRRPREITRTIRARLGKAKAEVPKLTTPPRIACSSPLRLTAIRPTAETPFSPSMCHAHPATISGKTEVAARRTVPRAQLGHPARALGYPSGQISAAHKRAHHARESSPGS